MGCEKENRRAVRAVSVSRPCLVRLKATNHFKIPEALTRDLYEKPSSDRHPSHIRSIKRTRDLLRKLKSRRRWDGLVLGDRLQRPATSAQIGMHGNSRSSGRLQAIEHWRRHRKL